MLRLLSFAGNPNVGVFARATDAHAFVPTHLTAAERAAVEEALEVKAVPLTLGGTSLVGSLIAANSIGAVVADVVGQRELAILKDAGLKIFLLADRMNAAGNNLLVTDAGGLCNPDFTDGKIKQFEKLFDVPFQRGTFAGLGTVGMAGVATSRGVLVHPKSTPEEREVARRALGKDVMVGTVNHGTGLIGAGLVANSKGAIIGSASTNIEIGRIEDALGFLPDATTHA